MIRGIAEGLELRPTPRFARWGAQGRVRRVWTGKVVNLLWARGPMHEFGFQMSQQPGPAQQITTRSKFPLSRLRLRPIWAISSWIISISFSPTVGPGPAGVPPDSRVVSVAALTRWMQRCTCQRHGIRSRTTAATTGCRPDPSTTRFYNRAQPQTRQDMTRGMPRHLPTRAQNHTQHTPSTHPARHHTSWHRVCTRYKVLGTRTARDPRSPRGLNDSPPPLPLSILDLHSSCLSFDCVLTPGVNFSPFHPSCTEAGVRPELPRPYLSLSPSRASSFSCVSCVSASVELVSSVPMSPA